MTTRAGSLNCTSTVLTYALGSQKIQGPIRIKARAGNVGGVALGGSDVTKTLNGLQLAPGEFIDLDFVVDVGEVYAASETANNKVDWIIRNFDD